MSCKQESDAAKLREAVMKIYQLAYEWEANERLGITGSDPDAKDSAETLFEIQSITTAALAAPPRNCDVGTDAEQERRFDEFCDDIRECGSDCPLFETEVSCKLAWAQMPYEEGGAK